MTFLMANEKYGLEILKVREIIGMMDITAVPYDTRLCARSHQSPRQGHPGH